MRFEHVTHEKSQRELLDIDDSRLASCEIVLTLPYDFPREYIEFGLDFSIEEFNLVWSSCLAMIQAHKNLDH